MLRCSAPPSPSRLGCAVTMNCPRCNEPGYKPPQTSDDPLDSAASAAGQTHASPISGSNISLRGRSGAPARVGQPDRPPALRLHAGVDARRGERSPSPARPTVDHRWRRRERGRADRERGRPRAERVAVALGFRGLPEPGKRGAGRTAPPVAGKQHDELPSTWGCRVCVHHRTSVMRVRIIAWPVTTFRRVPLLALVRAAPAVRFSWPQGGSRSH